MPAAQKPRQGKNCRRWGWTLGLLLVVVTQIHAEQLPIRTYTTADGLAQDRVKRIVRDSRGFLWFCTADGLSRFDGNHFVTYDATRGLSYPTVNDLLETSKGVYWVATNGGGVFLFDPDAAKASAAGGRDRQASRADGDAAKAPVLFFNYPVGDTPRTNRVNKLYEDSSGKIWAGTDHGVFVFDEKVDPQNFRNVAWAVPDLASQTVQVWAFAEDPEGNLWLGTTAGLACRSPEGRMKHYSPWPGGTGSVFDLFWDREGRLWASGRGLLIAYPESGVIATEGQSMPWRVLRRTPEALRERRIVLPVTRGEAYIYTLNDGLPHDYVVELLQASDGRLWLATHGGMSVLDGGRLRSYTKALGLKEQIFSAVAEDGDGNIWFGSNASGALKLAKNGLISYREEDGLNNSSILRIFEDDEGTLCVLVRTSSIYCLAGQKFYEIRLNLPSKPPRIDDLLHDHLGEWWVASGHGLYRFPAGGGVSQMVRSRPRKYTMADGLAGSDVRRLFEDSRGDIWIATTGPQSLTRWERSTGKFRAYSTADGIPEQSSVFSFAEDAGGGVWIGFRDHGLARYAGGSFALLTENEGLPSRQVPTVYIDRAGRLWAAVTARGLIRIDDPTVERPRIRVYSTADGLTSNFIPTITEDQTGRVYLGTTRSIDQLDPINERIRQYTVADGLAANESQFAYLDKRGTLWFGTANGLSRLIPEAEKAAVPPPILIGRVSIAGISQPVSELGETEVQLADLDHNQNQAQVEFFGLSFAPGEVLRYQFKLEGADGDWGLPVEQRSINYANLKPGSYRFLVRAVSADRVISARPASVAFTIMSPIWQRWWFLALAAIVVAAATHLIYLYHTRRLIELERVRTRIATDLHDDIGASLSKIAILSDVVGQEITAEDSRVTEPLAQIAGTSRDMVDAMSDIVWAVNPQRDHLSDLTQRMRRFAEDLLDARDIDFTFRVPPVDEKDIRLGADLRREVYLIFKECVNNLVKHSECTEAELEFRINGSFLFVSVGDNGRGFNPVEASPDGRTAGLGGHGLASMQRRARALGGTFVISSEKGRGTRVTLKVPTRNRQRRQWLPWRYPNGR